MGVEALHFVILAQECISFPSTLSIEMFLVCLEIDLISRMTLNSLHYFQ